MTNENDDGGGCGEGDLMVNWCDVENYDDGGCGEGEWWWKG